MKNTIYFVVPAIPESLQKLLDEDKPLPPPESLAPDKPPLRGAQWSWIFQTFLYMKQAGLKVALVDRPVPGEICVAHFATTKNKIWAPTSFVVGVRADNSPLRMREIEIVQSPANLGGEDVFLIHHWPQPKLISRDSARGDRIERISYFGGQGGLSPQFQEATFSNALKDLGVELHLCFDTTRWHDYQNTDLVLAVRNDLHPLLVNTKPASKLVNAWKSGCVALLGNEPAFRAVGRVGKDYFEVDRPQDVLNLVKQLKQDPMLYRQVRQSGLERYPEYSFEALQQQWLDLFTGPVAEAFEQWQKGLGKNPTACHVRRSWQSAYQWLDHKWFYSQVRSSQLVSRRLSQFQVQKWQLIGGER
ncbi:glycosyltransferase family 1 protein [Phormidium tenue FACHB-886]|nr:glycosyltransferase family 1 protein [Phormidium tenue FACHB-886]